MTLSVADWFVIGEFAAALGGLVYFVVRYAVSTGGHWRRSPEGRHLMLFRGSLALFMLMGVAHNFVDAYPGRDAVRVIVIGLFALSVMHGDLLLERAQAARRRKLQAGEITTRVFPLRRDAESTEERGL